MVNSTPFPRLLSGLGRAGLVLGVLGVLGLLVAIFSKSTIDFYDAYLYGWTFWATLTFGCYGLMLLQTMVRANWGFPVIRLFEAGAKMLPYILFAFIPILIGVYNGQLYPWANPARVAADPVLQHRQPYMNAFGFTFRTIVYFAVFSITTWMLTRLSYEQDRTGNLQLASNRASIAAPSFVIMVLLLTFGCTDWLMSLEPHWYSTIYGFWFCIVCALTAMSFVALLACLMKMAHVAPYETRIDRPVIRDFGNLLLMMCMVWAYFSLSQFLITWSGNLPDEVVYYYKRNVGILAWITTIMVTFEFFVPFLMLCSGKTKSRPHILSWVCVIFLIMRIIETAWNVLPFLHSLNAGLAVELTGASYCFASFFAIGGFWLWGFVNAARRYPLVPISAVAISEVYGHAS